MGVRGRDRHFHLGPVGPGFRVLGLHSGWDFGFEEGGGREMEVSVGGRGFWFLDHRVIGEERKSLNS